jgi:hypothetical protein
MDLIRKNIISFGEKRGRPYADSSISTYLRNIGKIYQKIHPEKEMSDMNWANDIGAVDKAIADFKPTTQRNYYNSIIIGMMALDNNDSIRKVYEGKRDILNAEYEKTKGQPTASQAKVMESVNKQTILDMLETTKDKVKENRMDHIAWMMFKIHTDLPFRNELSRIRILREAQYEKEADKTENYLLVGPKSNMRFIMNQGKTSAKYGPRNINISEDLRSNILDYLKHTDLFKRKYVEPTYLFSWATGKPLSRNDVSHLLSNFSNKNIGHSVSTTLMAKLFNNIPENVNEATEDEIKAVQEKALARGHSVKVKASIYNPQKNI